MIYQDGHWWLAIRISVQDGGSVACMAKPGDLYTIVHHFLSVLLARREGKVELE